MCGRLGIQGVYSQAYHHQANGRAEVQGRIFKDLLKKLGDTSKNGNWVELLPMVLRQYLDMPGPTGLSPYEIVFGRTRYISGVPYAPLRESEDAKRFFDRMQKQEIKVAEVLNNCTKTVEQIDKRRKRIWRFQVG